MGGAAGVYGPAEGCSAPSKSAAAPCVSEGVAAGTRVVSTNQGSLAASVSCCERSRCYCQLYQTCQGECVIPLDSQIFGKASCQIVKKFSTWFVAFDVNKSISTRKVNQFSILAKVDCESPYSAGGSSLDRQSVSACSIPVR
jgi:hypothetical protein